MAGEKSTTEIAAEYNISKTSVREWAKKYGEECQYKNTTSEKTGIDMTQEIRRRNQMLREKDKAWCTDFTYMCQHSGRTRYNCTIIALYDRSVIASVNDGHINTELAIATLKEALNAEKNPKGLILHSD